MKLMKKTICVILSLTLILTVFVVTMGSNTTKAQLGEPVKASYSSMLQPQSEAGTTLYCPGFLQGENSESYFFLYNPGGTEMEVELRFYDLNGFLVIIIIIIIIIIIKINPWQWGVEFNSGSIEICADGPLMGNMVSFETSDPETTYSVPLSAQTATTLYCPRFVQPTPDAYTECFLQNPNDDPAPTTITFYDDFGYEIGKVDESIDPHATLNFVPSDYGIEETSGSYKIQSLSGGLVGTTIERNEFGKASAIPLIAPSSSATLYCTEFVQSEDTKTYICLNNINDNFVSTTCNFYDENGGFINFATLTFDAHANIMFEPGEFGITHDKGNVVIHTEYGEVIGSSTICFESSGAISSTVLAASGGTTLISPGAFQTEHFDAYFQVQNPNDFPITVDIEFFDLDGNPLEGYVDQPIDAHGTINLQPHFPPSELTEFGAKIISNFIIIVRIIIIIIILYNGDWDGDGLSNYAEINIYGTDPWDPDTDDDKMNDGFEVNVYNTDPLYPNDKFAILVCTDSSWTDARYMYDVLTTQYRYSASEIRMYEGAPATAENLESAILDWVVPNDDPNDIVYIMIGSHGYIGGMVLRDRNVDYSEFDTWLDEIYCMRLIISIDNCHSGSALDDISEGPCPRVVYTACNRDELSNGYFHLKWNNALGRVDAEYQEADNDFGDGNGYVAVGEAFQYARYYTNLVYGDHPLESDDDPMWDNTYLGEYIDATFGWGSSTDDAFQGAPR